MQPFLSPIHLCRICFEIMASHKVLGFKNYPPSSFYSNASKQESRCQHTTNPRINSAHKHLLQVKLHSVIRHNSKLLNSNLQLLGLQFPRIPTRHAPQGAGGPVAAVAAPEPPVGGHGHWDAFGWRLPNLRPLLASNLSPDGHEAPNPGFLAQFHCRAKPSRETLHSPALLRVLGVNIGSIRAGASVQIYYCSNHAQVSEQRQNPS
jgi:ribosomal protein S14